MHRRLGLSCLPIEPAQTEMTVGAQRSHADSLGAIECQLVTLFGTLERERMTPRVNLTQKPQRPGFVAALAALAGDVERLIRKIEGVLDSAGEQACLAKVLDQA